MVELRKIKFDPEESENHIPLNCVDKGLLALSGTNDYPHFHWIMKISGDIDEVSLSRAILSAFNTHPNMATKVYRHNLRTFRRTETPVVQNVLSFIDLTGQQKTNLSTESGLPLTYEEILDTWINKSFDPTKEFPVRILLLKTKATESHLVFSFDHSSVDGIRSLRFIQEVVSAHNGRPIPRPSLSNTIRHVKRDQLIEFARRQKDITKGFYKNVISSILYRLFVAPTSPPSRVFTDKKEKSDTTGHCFGTIDAWELEQIQEKARAACVTLNDIFLAACFRTIDYWNNMHGKGCRKITIMVPTNIGLDTLDDIISNQVSCISLPTMPQDRTNPIELLHKIRRDMTSMIKNGISFSIIYYLYFLSFLPLPLVKTIARIILFLRVYIDTIILSNLGVIWPSAWGDARIGNAKIEDINLVMPVVTTMGLSLGTCTYNGRLQICLSYKTSMFTEENAQRFLSLYLEELRNYPIVGISELEEVR